MWWAGGRTPSASQCEQTNHTGTLTNTQNLLVCVEEELDVPRALPTIILPAIKFAEKKAEKKIHPKN